MEYLVCLVAYLIGVLVGAFFIGEGYSFLTLAIMGFVSMSAVFAFKDLLGGD